MPESNTPEARKVGWKLASASFEVASVRYRALFPALALQEAGIASRVFTSAATENLEGLDVLVIVKSFKTDDVLLAQKASERGIRVVLDLCDNIFIKGYGGPSQQVLLETFHALSGHLDAVVTTTQPLADAISLALPNVPVYVIPDGIENPALLASALALLRASVSDEARHRRKLTLSKIKYDLLCLVCKGPRVYRSIAKSWVRGILKSGRQVLRQWSKHRARMQAKKNVRVSTPEAPSGHARQIVWFGNHGAPHARFGMLDLLDIKDALEAAAKEFDVLLVVISNNREKYLKHIQPLAIPSVYVEWTPEVVAQYLATASLVVIPNSLDAFSLCKSANRTVLALQHSVPVVATPTPALEPLAPHIHLGDPLEGIRRYLGDPVAAREDAVKGAQLAGQLFGQSELSHQWVLTLDRLRQQPPRLETANAQILVVLHLIQDLDLALPIIKALKEQHGLQVHVLASTVLVKKSPRVLVTLREQHIPFRIMSEDDLVDVDFPRDTAVMLTVTETNLGPHRFSRRLTELARKKGMFAATLQHGYENVGLTYGDAEHPIKSVDFAADRIYIWGPISSLHQDVSRQTRERCVPVGCPKPSHAPTANLDQWIPENATVIGIFENLHWKRYSDAYRSAFVECVQTLADNFPQLVFLVKPHHAGLWLTHRHRGNRPQSTNMVIADPQTAPWERHTASALLGRMRCVITTPSTVALDAARMGLPTAVFSFDLALTNYSPLPLIREPSQAMSFVEHCSTSDVTDLRRASTAFVDRAILAGDAAQRIADDLAAVVRSRQALNPGHSHELPLREGQSVNRQPTHPQSL